MELREFNNLLKKYHDGTLSKQERILLNAWYNQYATGTDKQPDHEELEKRLKSIAKKLPVESQVSKSKKTNYYIAIAASVLIAISVSIWWSHNWSQTKHQIVQNDISPGGNKATLVFSNGEKINLSEEHTGIVVKDDDIYYSDGSTVSINEQPTEKINLLELRTPLKGTYQITLSDGTRVWLNAESTLKYPAQFSGSTREVHLAGEGYFEVMHDADKPFKVLSLGQEIEVTGTAFNVLAYEGEPNIRTTLVEGSVKIINKASGVINALKPGQQSTLVNGNIHISQTDISTQIAWKEGLFRYNNQSLEDIMHHLSRWYGVEVVYEDESMKAERFVGMVSRYSNISVVLAILEEVGDAKFTLTRNTVIVNKKQPYNNQTLKQEVL